MSKRVSVVVRLGEEPASVERLEQLASALLSLNRCRYGETHAGFGWTGHWDNWWFADWGTGPADAHPAQGDRAWEPCPACHGAAATSCGFCHGQSWQKSWDALRRVAPMTTFVEALRSGRIGRPRYFVTPDARVRAAGETSLDELLEWFDDCWVVSTRCYF